METGARGRIVLPLDLEIFAREGDAYVETVLEDGDGDAYFARRATES